MMQKRLRKVLRRCLFSCRARLEFGERGYGIVLCTEERGNAVLRSQAVRNNIILNKEKRRKTKWLWVHEIAITFCQVVLLHRKVYDSR